VAHELNNPVSNIWSSCQLLQDDATLSAEQRELLQQIDEQCVRARNIIRSLLDFGRDRPFARENVVLVDLVEQTLRFLKGERPSALTVSVDVPAELAVPADRQRLQQALLNLIRNAIDASAEHIAVSARKHSEAPRTDDDSVAADCPDAPWLEILVRDDGHGIPPDVLPRIFDPFFTTKEVGRGMGIGLFIAYQIIEEHDGCIGVQSRPGEGTRFAVRLPAPANNGNTP
jgi:signal transduction histidine kinase